MATDLHQEILHACQRADTILWSAFARGNDNAPSAQPTSHLVFPRYRDKRLRVSEQEARFAFVEALCEGPLHYSVETPTRKCYGFSSKGKQSAMTDLTVRNEKMTVLCNVEFKYGGYSQDAKNLDPIYKDIEKLVREPVPGLWFHVLRGVTNQTINRLLDVLSNKDHYHFEDIESPGITVHICVLKHGFSIQKYFAIPRRSEDDFLIDLSVSRTELLKIIESNGWMLNRR